jgi:hypothetical protein
MRKCEFCGKFLPLDRVKMHAETCSERIYCENCHNYLAKSQLEAHSQACAPSQLQPIAESIAVEGPVAAAFTRDMRIPAPLLADKPLGAQIPRAIQQEEEAKQLPLAQVSAPSTDIPMIKCKFCKLPVEARSTIHLVFKDHLLCHTMQEQSLEREFKRQYSHLPRDINQSFQRFADIESRRNLARHADDDSYFSPENYDVSVRQELLKLDGEKYVQGKGLKEGELSLLRDYAYEGEEMECVICKEVIVPENRVKRLPCLHVFHSACIDSWASRVPKCPIDNSHIALD